jgi:ribosomal-protein-alanine N-acetyltransferase
MLEFNLHPFPTITTDRLVLRKFEESDLEDLLRIRTDPDVMLYINKEEQTREIVANVIKQIIANWENNESINWAVCLKDDPRLIGNFGFWRVDKYNHRAEVGYMLAKTHWRKGYLNELMPVALDYAFDVMKLHSIEANINAGNDASRNLLQKFDFQQEAYFKENYYFNGGFIDSVIFSLLKDWRKK